MPAYEVYVLWSPLGQRFYIGLSEDVVTRLYEHNSGRSKWTKRYAGSWVLVWRRTCPSLTEARKLEARLKRQKHGDGFWSMTRLQSGDYPATGS